MHVRVEECVSSAVAVITNNLRIYGSFTGRAVAPPSFQAALAVRPAWGTDRQILMPRETTPLARQSLELVAFGMMPCVNHRPRLVGPLTIISPTLTHTHRSTDKTGKYTLPGRSPRLTTESDRDCYSFSHITMANCPMLRRQKVKSYMRSLSTV